MSASASGTSRAPTLASLLAPVAGCVTVTGCLRLAHSPVLSRTLDGDPGVRAVGVLFLGCGWYLLRFSPRVSTGLRRWLTRLCAAGLVFTGAVQAVGPDALAMMDTVVPWGQPAGLRTLLGGVVLCALTAYAWASSPLRR